MFSWRILHWQFHSLLLKSVEIIFGPVLHWAVAPQMTNVCQWSLDVIVNISRAACVILCGPRSEEFLHCSFKWGLCSDRRFNGYTWVGYWHRYFLLSALYGSVFIRCSICVSGLCDDGMIVTGQPSAGI